jgi:DNA-directed RNA polymerase subunit RPC12/RpoP
MQPNKLLMNCPACGHQVSKKAATCPACGHRIAFGLVMFSAILGGIFFAALLAVLIIAVLQLANLH